MIEIKKGKVPGELIQYRKQPDATYSNMHGAILAVKKLLIKIGTVKKVSNIKANSVAKFRKYVSLLR